MGRESLTWENSTSMDTHLLLLQLLLAVQISYQGNKYGTHFEGDIAVRKGARYITHNFLGVSLLPIHF